MAAYFARCLSFKYTPGHEQTYGPTKSQQESGRSFYSVS